MDDSTNELYPQSVNYGKFHNKDALIQALPEGSSEILKEKFSNQARLMMWVKVAVLDIEVVISADTLINKGQSSRE